MQDNRSCQSGPNDASTGVELRVRNLVKRFDDVLAVNDVSFSVPGGLLLCLLGPSGSGKTTVLRLLGGFETPDQGAIQIDGRDISRLPPYRRDIGMVFQRYALFPHMSVAENVEFSLAQRRVSNAERESRVEEMLEAVGLSGYGHRRPTQLSGGQQQRVALARALVFKPRILVMDEPLAALDKGLREQMQQEIRSLQCRLRITTVYVTHDQTEAFAMSDLVAVMNAGRIEQIDAPRTLYEAPRTEFVARFVGDSNLFRGEAVSMTATGKAIRLPDGTLVRYPASSKQTGQLTLLVRPEKISMHAPSEIPSSGENLLHGRVTDVVFLGETLNYRVTAGGQEVIVRSQNHAGVTISRPGEPVALSWTVSDTVVL